MPKQCWRRTGGRFGMRGRSTILGKYLSIVSVLIVTIAYSKDISPLYSLPVSGMVSDFVVDEGKLYVATDEGSIDIFDLRTQKIVDRIVLEPIPSSGDELVPAAILSVDRMNGKTLFVSVGRGGYRDIWIYEGFKLTKVKGAEEKIFAKKARFADDEHILMGTFGSDVILYDRNEGYSLYHNHISPSAMGGMALSEDRQTAVMADESGAVRLIDVGTAEIKQEFSSENLDNIYSVAYRGGVLLTASEDRRVGVYLATVKPYHLRSDFLVYAVALSPSGEQGIYSSGTEQHLQLFNTRTGTRGDRLVGHLGIVNKIHFLTEKILISVGNEQNVYVWKLD